MVHWYVDANVDTRRLFQKNQQLLVNVKKFTAFALNTHYVCYCISELLLQYTELFWDWNYCDRSDSTCNHYLSYSLTSLSQSFLRETSKLMRDYLHKQSIQYIIFWKIHSFMKGNLKCNLTFFFTWLSEPAAPVWVGAKKFSMKDRYETTVLSSEQISKILPHRYPFLLVDRVVEFEAGRSLVRYDILFVKCVLIIFA